MSYQYKGRGLLQTTGKNSMALFNQLSPITINGSGLSNTINLASSINLSSPDTYQSFDLFGSSNEYIKKYEMIESAESILTLSVTAHRLFKDTKVHYKLTDREVFHKIIPEDRVQADNIKDYYSKKIMMWKLQGNNKLSSFREDMNKLIHSDMLIFKENMIGIAYWLPQFYQYDVDLDVIKSDLTINQNFEKMNKSGTPGVLKLSEKLIPMSRLERRTKRNKYHEYWFKDEKHNAGVVIHLEDKNQLQHLWDSIFNKKQSLTIEGWYTRRHRDGFEYYSVKNWSLS